MPGVKLCVAGSPPGVDGVSHQRPASYQTTAIINKKAATVMRAATHFLGSVHVYSNGGWHVACEGF
jgi:hypothetical protein